ncbi:MAG TPA: carbon storage regulator [Caulifigura sp.]|nr:carbon storage regulator [Caulifigura sp.]
MLILQRDHLEAITVGDDVLITVMRIRQGSVRLGICCPFDRPIHRASAEDALAWRLAHIRDGRHWAGSHAKLSPVEVPIEVAVDLSTLAERRQLVLASAREGGA